MPCIWEKNISRAIIITCTMRSLYLKKRNKELLILDNLIQQASTLSMALINPMV